MAKTTQSASGRPGAGEAPDRELLLRLYQRMVLIRRFEERAGQAYGQGKIMGFCHLYIGEEAVAVGGALACRESDYTLAGYREHGHALARGADPNRLMAELFGKAAGYAKGKGGSMHIFDVAHRFMGGYGIVGGQIPLAAGIAWASHYRQDGTACVCFLGDAAVNQGAYHESMNMAALWKLPVVYVVENNLYGMGTPVKVASAVSDLSRRSGDYGVPGEAVDGMDAVAVYQAVSRALARARRGEGPTLLEARCYRFRGHSMADPATYRTKEEVESYKQHDPLAVMRAHLAAAQVPEAEWKKLDEEAQARVKEALQFAERAPEPAPEALYEDVLGS